MEYSIRELRARNHMTQAVLAKKMYVSRATIVRWEQKGLERVQMRTVLQLAKHFGVQPSEIQVNKGETDASSEAIER